MSGKIFGERWEIIRPITEGGQAHIYLVKDIRAQEEKLCSKKIKERKKKG